MLPELPVPVIAAPMAGGPSTPRLVAAVSSAGGLGFLAAGYKRVDRLRAEITELRALSDRPFGVNVFLPGPPAPDQDALLRYRERLRPCAARLGVDPGDPHWDDDDLDAKVEALAGVPLVSTTFGCPSVELVGRLHASGSAVVVTVTSVDEARQAGLVGPDALWVQGQEAGGHRGSFSNDAGTTGDAAPLLALLHAVHQVTDLPLYAAGGLMDGGDVAAVIAAGATAGALGTALLCCPEAGTHPTHRAALRDPRFTRTTTTRAFTGRPARSLVNTFLVDNDAAAPHGYPEVHHITRPLRAAAAAAGDPDNLHLWAGTGWQRLRPQPAEDLVRLLHSEM